MADERTKEALEMVEKGVREIFSSENFREYLSFLSRFHSYSLSNTILIMSQYPQATLVAGFNSWRKKFNRFVRRGEKAIRILAPYETRSKVLVEKRDEKGRLLIDENGIVQKEEIEQRNVSFMVVNVFDVSQTEGDPLPTFMKTKELSGTSKEIQALYRAIRKICKIPVAVRSADADRVLKNGAKGYYDKLHDRIVINGSMSDKQKLKTLAHEYAHSLLHKQTDKPETQREIEAESLAYVICDHFGIDTGDYSFSYVASYASEDLSSLKEILLNIHESAHTIISSIEPAYKESLKELGADKTVESSVPLCRENYHRLCRFAGPVLRGDAFFMKLTSPGKMELNIEKIGEDRVALSHTYYENGEVMADPDMELVFDNEKEVLKAESYQLDALGICERAGDREESGNDLNAFLSDWLRSIERGNYRIAEIETEDKEMNYADSFRALKEYCRPYGLLSRLEGRREKER